MSYKDIKSFEQECKEKDAEIERLKAELDTEKKISDKFLHDLQTQTRLAGSYMAKLFTAQEMITKFCDALEGYCWDESGLNHDPEAAELVERAREATR